MAAQLLAPAHHALDGEGAAQDAGGLGRLAVAQRVADARRGELVAVAAGHGFGDRNGEAVFVAIHLQQVGAAAAAAAERDVEAGGDVLHAQALDQHLFDELAVAEASHLEVERQQIEQVDAEAGQRPGLLAVGHQLEGRLGWPEQAARVRVEGDHPQRRMVGQRRFRGLRDHLLVAAMHAVEIAQRHGGAALVGGEVLPGVDSLERHQAALRGTMTTASPSTTALPPTLQTVARVTWALASLISEMVTTAVTSSPILTGRLNFSVCDR